MQQRTQHQGVENLSREGSASESSTSIASLLLWLIMTALVAVVGAALLEYEQVGQSLPSALWSLGVLVGEVILYLLVLTAFSAGRMVAGRAFAGTVLGLVVRGALSVVTAELPIVSRGGLGGFFDNFIYFYLLYWPAVAVQICAVAIFLLRVREAWSLDETDEDWGGLEEQSSGGELEDRAERQRILLAALKESGEPGEAQPTEGEAADNAEPTDAGFYEDVGSSLSPALPFDELRDEELGVDIAGGEDESANDTSPIPVIAEECDEKTAGEEETEASEAQVSERLLADYSASGHTPFAGGVLVWGGELAVDDARLGQAVAALVAGASALGRATGLGDVELLLIEAEGGCWALSADPERENWWTGVVESAPTSPGMAAVSVRKAMASLADADIPPQVDYPAPPSVADLPVSVPVVSHPLADPLLEQWGLQLSLAESEDGAVLAALPPGADASAVTGGALHLWQAARQIADMTQWEQAQTVLVGGKLAAAVGRASWQGQPAVLATSSRDSVRIAGARVLLTQLARKLDDFGPQYRPASLRAPQD